MSVSSSSSSSGKSQSSSLSSSIWCSKSSLWDFIETYSPAARGDVRRVCFHFVFPDLCLGLRLPRQVEKEKSSRLFGFDFGQDPVEIDRLAFTEPAFLHSDRLRGLLR